MDEIELNEVLKNLLALPGETEWVEFKLNWTEPEDIGERNYAFNKPRTYISTCSSNVSNLPTYPLPPSTAPQPFQGPPP